MIADADDTSFEETKKEAIKDLSNLIRFHQRTLRSIKKAKDELQLSYILADATNELKIMKQNL